MKEKEYGGPDASIYPTAEWLWERGGHGWRWMAVDGGAVLHTILYPSGQCGWCGALHYLKPRVPFIPATNYGMHL